MLTSYCRSARHVVGRVVSTSKACTGQQRRLLTTTGATTKTSSSHAAMAGGLFIAGGCVVVVAAAAATSSSTVDPTAVPVFSTNLMRMATCRCEDIVNTGHPVKEPQTGILFPQLCNGYYFVGCGVRIKYVFVKVYAVATYMDPLAMDAIKKSAPENIEQALLDPAYPRTIRIVMNRNLSVDKFTAAIVEALEPRMKGQDLDKLDAFKKMNPAVDLVQGAEIEMTIRGDTLLYKNAMGGVETIRSAVFTKALCDVYYGIDPVSPDHKQDVLKGIPKL